MAKNNNAEEKHNKQLERIGRLRMLDDVFMTACLQDNIKAVEFIIQIIMDDKRIRIVEMRVQREIKNVYGRSVRLDVFAKDDKGKIYNLEFERSKDGADPRRSRFNGALIDGNAIPAGSTALDLPEVYVIIIAEKDISEYPHPLYHVDKTLRETGEPYDDGMYPIFVNASYVNKDTELGRLMHDLSCTKASDMYYPILAEQVRYFKETEGGLQYMCKVLEEEREDGRAEGRIEGRKEAIEEMVLNALRKGHSPEEVSEFNDVPLNDVIKIKKKYHL